MGLSATNTYVFHLLEVILEFFILLRLLGAILVDLLEPLADIFFVLLAALVEVDTRFIIGDPALAEVAELAALGLPIIRPAITAGVTSYKYLATSAQTCRAEFNCVTNTASPSGKFAEHKPRSSNLNLSQSSRLKRHVA